VTDLSVVQMSSRSKELNFVIVIAEHWYHWGLHCDPEVWRGKWQRRKCFFRRTGISGIV